MAYVYALTILSLWVFISSIQRPIKRQKEYELKTRKKYGNAIAYHMVTNGLSHRKAQKRVEMETLVREDERRSFTAMVDCPKCGVWAIHWLKGGRRGRVTRQCRECEHEWKQE